MGLEDDSTVLPVPINMGIFHARMRNLITVIFDPIKTEKNLVRSEDV